MTSPAVVAPAPTGRGTGAGVSVLLAVVLALGAAAAQMWLVHGLVRLPAELFGGDYLYQMGCIQSILASRDPMASCSTCGALPGYLPLYGTLAALFSGATGLPVWQGMLILSVILRALSALVAFTVFARLFGHRAGVVLAALWVALHAGLLVKYTDFTAAIVVPFYYLALVRFAESPRPRRAVALGLVLAVAGYSHAVAFIGGAAVATLTALAAALWRARSGQPGRELAAGAGGLALAAAGALPALGYWWRPIFEYHGRTSLHYTEWQHPSLATLDDRLSFAGGQLRAFVDPGNGVQAMAVLLFVLGLVLVWRAPARRRFAPGLLVAAVTLAWALHYFVTMPLAHVHFIPDYIRRLLWDFAFLLVVAVPVVLVSDRLRGRAATLVPVVTVLVAFAVLAGQTRALRATPDLVAAHRTLPPHYLEMQRVVLEHTDPDDVVLSTNELSFAWSALTGRKTLVTRRAQNDAFVDMDERNRDAALILYGHDDALRRRLLARWHVKYLLWTEDWIPGEYGSTSSGDLEVRDPLSFFTNPNDEAALDRAGVQTARLHTWVDPSLRTATYPRFDLTFVTPGNYSRLDRPWSPQLDELLTEVWSATIAGRRVAAVYLVRSQGPGRR